jgi:CheY-like chemotaxis protein
MEACRGARVPSIPSPLHLAENHHTGRTGPPELRESLLVQGTFHSQNDENNAITGLPPVALHWHAKCCLRHSSLFLLSPAESSDRSKTTERLRSRSVGTSMPVLSLVRVLVVDDYEPFRRFVCSTLGKRPGLHIVGEALDGLAAVRQAEELKPDLILLDIGLPSADGLQAAREILKLSPDSKIVFVSQESNPDVVQEAFNLGARGYVAKTRAASDLLAAADAVLEGGRFVSSGLTGCGPD